MIRGLLSATSAALAIALFSAAAPGWALSEGGTPEELKAGTSVLSDRATKSNDAQYEQARADLPEDYYVLYRIVERISRANAIDVRPWRVIVVPEYDINAFATEINLIAFFSGLLDQVYGDPNAIACVVGHEMAHHTEEHIALSAADREMRLQALRDEAFEEVVAEEDDLRDDLEEMGIGEWAAGNVGSLASVILPGLEGSILGGIGNLIGGEIRRSRQRRIENAVERIEQIYAEKEAEFIAEETARNHAHEFEADEIGYQYMVRAGFNPQGCITVFEALNRMPGSQQASLTHPATPDRIAAINAMSAQYPTTTLEAEGTANLAASPSALSYNLSEDRTSLRVNSRAGSTDIDDLLPQ